MNGPRPFPWIAGAIYLAVPALVVCSIWVPVINHYRVRAPRVTEQMVQAARQSPSDSVLRELERFRLMPLSSSNGQELIRIAATLLSGRADIPGYPAVRIGVPFDPRDVDGVPTVWQLPLASLALPGILLDASNATGRQEFLLTARDMILMWGRYERRAWLPAGSMWNDHAVAARVAVLTELWRLYRRHPSYQSELGKEILEQVERSAALLAKQRHFTFASNHGIMQNAALLQVSAAFPMLPEVQRYRDLALSRLHDQMEFFVDDEGVVLEHSAEYHRWGLELLGMICRSLALLQQPIPDEWRRKYERAETVFAALRRPDGSLPTFGDTDGSSDDAGPLVTSFDALGQSEALLHRRRWVPAKSLSFYPIAGNAIWWEGLEHWPSREKLRQTVATWSYFPGHAHKSADEMSVIMWGAGQTWWTNVGYWPYAMAGRSDAESWQNGNAPHLVNESVTSARNTSVLSYGWSRRLGMVDLERRGPGRYTARREVVHLKPDVWLIVDHASGDDKMRTTTTWTTAPDVILKKDTSAASYVLEARHAS